MEKINIKNMDLKELNELFVKTKYEILNLRLKRAMNQLTNIKLIRDNKKIIARIKTELTDRKYKKDDNLEIKKS